MSLQLAEPPVINSGMTLTCVVNSADTDGDLLLYDTVRHENGGSGYHVPHTQDEWFYVISGGFIVKVVTMYSI